MVLVQVGILADRDDLGGVDRAQGRSPGLDHLLQLALRELRSALTGPSGLHAVLDVVLEGETEMHPSILKEYQRDPIRGHVRHIDLQEVRLDVVIQATVQVHLQGGEDAPGVKEGGVLSQPSTTPEGSDFLVAA